MVRDGIPFATASVAQLGRLGVDVERVAAAAGVDANAGPTINDGSVLRVLARARRRRPRGFGPRPRRVDTDERIERGVERCAPRSHVRRGVAHVLAIQASRVPGGRGDHRARRRGRRDVSLAARARRSAALARRSISPTPLLSTRSPRASRPRTARYTC